MRQINQINMKNGNKCSKRITHRKKVKIEANVSSFQTLISRKDFVVLSSVMATATLGLSFKQQTLAAEIPKRFSMEERLVWTTKSQIAKDAKIKNLTYSKLFITYLTRFLLTYDQGEREYWDYQARLIPLSESSEAVAKTRRAQFAEFAEAVELGLVEFQGRPGAIALFSLLLSRYGDSIESRRQVAILFSLLQTPEQPTERMIELVASTDNGYISSIVVGNPGQGYCEENPPKVTISPPVTGTDRAQAKAVLRETGKIRTVKLLSRGCGYKHPPKVIFSEPGDPTGIQAAGEAVLDKSGAVKEIKITNPGSGYNNLFEPTVSIELPDDNSLCGTLPEGEVLLDYEVAQIEVVKPGSGYAVSLPIKIQIESPTEPDGTIIEGTAARAVVITQRQQAFDSKTLLTIPPTQTSVSAQLTKLLDSDVYFPEWNPEKRVFFLSGIEAFMDEDEPENEFYDAAFLNPEFFGPIGRSPVEREKAVGLEGYLRLASSGALCTGVVRAVLHPIDLVKCRSQSLPDQYPNIIQGFKKCKEENILLRGFDLSTFNGLVIGVTSFGFVEFFRRTLTTLANDYAVKDASIPIVLVSSGLSTLITNLFVIAFETIRLQVVTIPASSDFKGSWEYGKDLLKSKGFAYLFQGYFPLVSRDLPFTITKFLVYDLVQKALLLNLPAAQEDPSLTLLISLAAGLVAGVTGAIVTTPPDNVLTRLSKEDDEADWKDIVRKILQENDGGFLNLFRGVGLRCFYFGSLISLQFFLYDYFKVLLQVSSDDFKLVLDVFADRLSFYDQGTE